MLLLAEEDVLSGGKSVALLCTVEHVGMRVSVHVHTAEVGSDGRLLPRSHEVISPLVHHFFRNTLLNYFLSCGSQWSNFIVSPTRSKYATIEYSRLATLWV